MFGHTVPSMAIKTNYLPRTADLNELKSGQTLEHLAISGVFINQTAQ